jgi:hypothetical protein
MDGISDTEALIGLLIAGGVMWAPVFAFAYFRRPFGGSARNYVLAFGGTWFATVALFVAMAIWERS